MDSVFKAHTEYFAIKDQEAFEQMLKDLDASIDIHWKDDKSWH